ncbi:MAG: DUF3604 domain-containing protein [Pseudomonadales bacterium]
MMYKNSSFSIKSLLFAVLSLVIPESTLAVEYSPNIDQPPARQLLWGDTHLHTSDSSDAALRGNQLGGDAAYRFARGEEVLSTSGVRARLKQPLDFLVIADHSDGMGFTELLANGHPQIMAHDIGRRWFQMLKDGNNLQVSKEMIGGFSQGILPWKTNDPELMQPVWNKYLETAEQYNDPGRFTALIGYEWTSLVRGNNLHRVVVYRDGPARAGKMLPYTLGDSADPEDLWAYLASYEKKTGGSVLAIPHNSNLSNGMMFAKTTLLGDELSESYVRQRHRWEPLVEISQIKGDSEAHPLLSPNDEFAEFETWDIGNLDLSQAKEESMLPYEYIRPALKHGLEIEAKLGVNPFQFGIIASTDSHTSLATADESNFFGKHSATEPSAGRAIVKHRKGPVGMYFGWEQVSSGYAAVWAAENTREAIWDAMKRKEVYGTTGSRIAVRMFGGWGFTAEDIYNPNMVAEGYAHGVPMGGTLFKNDIEKEKHKVAHGEAKRENNAHPGFLITAQRDPQGANLDRIQVVKGWLNEKGESQEQIYNVAWSGERTLSASGKLSAVGNTVDVKAASWANSIGAAELTTFWEDPDFEEDQSAFYYVRVLEIPTPRWPAYDAARYEYELPTDVRSIIQDRAYTSPIWYKPEMLERH